jgi:hypothetical protein
LNSNTSPSRCPRRATSCAERFTTPGHSTATSVTDVLVDQDDHAHWIIYQRWETVEHDQAYRNFRAAESQPTKLPPLLAAPPVKTRYSTTDV